jgi:hypothetical protein
MSYLYDHISRLRAAFSFLGVLYFPLKRPKKTGSPQ